MNCIIIEDQMPAQRILKKYIADTGSLNLVGAYTDALAAIQILKSEKIDLIFLDIHLPKISGMDFLKSLPNPPEVILTTAFQDYAVQSYELNVVDYLLKPFSFQRFVKAISKVGMQADTTSVKIEQQKSESTKQVYIKSGYDHIRIEIDTIFYIMADSIYTELHLKDKKYLSSQPLRYWEEYLLNEQFIRIHKSYIINSNKITRISGNQIFLENNKALPIGRAYKNDFTKRFIQ